mmetsp:Transcript_43006/g.31401  ORF Transcript_43006/g.31401 Transcript_43006/m.31401 type:complete len:126 (+) Transcript_43006:63-440(+)
MRNFGHLPRKMKTFKRDKYECIPEWMTPAERDPFNYKLRSKEDIIHEFKYFTHPMELGVAYKGYPSGDKRVEDNIDNRDRVAKVFVSMNSLGLSTLQRERFIYLLGPRYTGSDNIKIVCRRFNTY